MTATQEALRTQKWLNKYTSQIRLIVPTCNITDIPSYGIPHPTNIKYGKTLSTVTWHIKGHFEKPKPKAWYNDIVIKISLCLSATNDIESVGKELTQPVNNLVYELKDFNSVDDQRYWRGKKIYIPKNFTINEGDYQYSIIKSIAYSLKRENILSKDLLEQMARSQLIEVKEKWFKYQINVIYKWTRDNYTGRKPRDSDGTRAERALKNSKQMSDSNYSKVDKQAFIGIAMGLKPSNKAIKEATGLSKNTVKKHLNNLIESWGQSIRTIRGKSESHNSYEALMVCECLVNYKIGVESKYRECKTCGNLVNNDLWLLWRFSPL